MDFSLEVASVRAFTHPLGSWHSGINVPSQGSGGNAAPPEPMHQDPSGSFSGNCGVQAQLHFPRPRCLGPNPCPLTCGRPLPGGGAPGPSLGGRGHCRAAFGCWGAAPPGARPTTGGKRRERARAAGPSLISIPSSHAETLGASVRMRSRGSRGLLRRRWRGRRGWAQVQEVGLALLKANKDYAIQSSMEFDLEKVVGERDQVLATSQEKNKDNQKPP